MKSFSFWLFKQNEVLFHLKSIINYLAAKKKHRIELIIVSDNYSKKNCHFKGNKQIKKHCTFHHDFFGRKKGTRPIFESFLEEKDKRCFRMTTPFGWWKTKLSYYPYRFKVFNVSLRNCIQIRFFFLFQTIKWTKIWNKVM